MKSTCALAIVLVTCACLTLEGRQRSTPAPPARIVSESSHKVMDQRPPLDPSRTAYVDDQSGGAGAKPLQTQLRAAGLWTAVDRREDADLVVTLTRAASTQAAARQPKAAYRLTVRSVRSTSSAPLWESVGNSPDALVKRLKAEVAPTFCFAVWCR